MNYESLDSSPSTITLLLKGPPGSGKTQKAAQFPSPVLFNFDNNTNGLRKLPAEVQKRIRLVNPRKDMAGKDVQPVFIWDNFVKQLEAVAADSTVRTIIIDSLSSLANALTDKILKTSAPDSTLKLQQWGDFQRYLKWFGEELLNNKSRNFNVVVIAHESVERDEATQSVSYSLNIGGQMKNSFDMFFSDCWRCYTKSVNVTPTNPSGVEYRVRLAPTSQFNAKCSLANVPPDILWDVDSQKILSQLK